MTDESINIKKFIEQGKVILGTKLSLERLKQGKLAAIYTSSNCPKQVKDDIDYYAGLNQTKVVPLTEDNEELGVICKKPFLISVLGVLK